MPGWGPFDLSGKAAIVTGAAMGIGRGIAKRFLEAGANVLLADVDESALHATVRGLPATGAKAAVAVVDVARPDAGERMVSECVRSFGRVDVLVNNAGIFPQVPILKMSPELFDRVWSINVRGLVFASRAAAQRMIEQGQGGGIINISSVDAFHPSMVGLGAYDSSKGAVTMFTKALALEVASHRIRVNAIAPGGITTEGASKPLEGSGMTPEQMRQLTQSFVQSIPMRRMGTPDEIACAAVFLASEAASYVTGTTLIVDGGMLLS